MKMMEPLQFYQRLRERDAPRVESLVGQLKEQQFEVYATGSSLSQADYRDIDLVVVSDESLATIFNPASIIAARRNIDNVILSFLERVVRSEGILESPPNDYASAHVEATYAFPSLPKPGTYAHSGVSERRKIEFRGTTIDITLTQTPFWMNPDAERVKL